MAGVVEDVKQRPHEIGHGDRVPAASKKLSVGKGCGRILPVEEAKRGDEEKNRHAKARTDVKKRHEMKIWRGIREVLRADVDADDAHHGDAADRLDCGEPRRLIR